MSSKRGSPNDEGCPRRYNRTPCPCYNPIAMPEIRPAHADELDRVHLVVAYSFTGDRSQEGRERMRHVEELANPRVLIEDGEIVASLRVYDFTVLVNGAPVPMGGVSSVACLPEYRRGNTWECCCGTRSSRCARPDSRCRRSTRRTRRCTGATGGMVAAANLKVALNPKHVRPYNPSGTRGRAVRTSEEDQPVVEEVFRRFSERRTGPLVRSDRWWREAFFRRIYDTERKLADVAVWYSENQEPTGYICYESSRGPPPMGTSKMWLREFVALSGDAYQGLLRYILSHDLTDEVFWYGPLRTRWRMRSTTPTRSSASTWTT